MPETTDDSGSSSTKKKQTFATVAKAAGIKPATIARLSDHDFDSVDAIKELHDDDVPFLEVTRGQERMLIKWRNSLTTPAPTPTPIDDDNIIQPPAAIPVPPVDGESQQPKEPTGSGVTLPAMARDKELRELLASLHRNGGRTERFLDLMDDARDTPEDTRSSGKPLLIPDFVSRARGRTDPDEQELVNHGSTQLVLRASRVKPRLEQVTMAEWMGANARIMQKLVSDNKLASHEDISCYLQYVADVSDYAQVCEWESLMVYDNEYRKKQVSQNRRWGEDDIHLATFYLQRKGQSNRRPQVNTGSRPSRPPRLSDNNGVEICRNYNGQGCFRNVCQYSHVCSVCKDGSHTRSWHNTGRQTS